jgi:hypothetical protein
MAGMPVPVYIDKSKVLFLRMRGVQRVSVTLIPRKHEISVAT